MYFCVVHGLLHCFHPCIMKSFYLVNIMFGIGFTRQVVVFSGFLVMGTRSLSFMVLGVFINEFAPTKEWQCF